MRCTEVSDAETNRYRTFMDLTRKRFHSLLMYTSAAPLAVTDGDYIVKFGAMPMQNVVPLFPVI